MLSDYILLFYDFFKVKKFLIFILCKLFEKETICTNTVSYRTLRMITLMINFVSIKNAINNFAPFEVTSRLNKHFYL